ncbi:hypothetical protein AB0F91_31405 [Amycolatopsis sp. NPDC023774]|uniref:hypothetical protein n=1 Tax=Amycolatopsis sp. NPDC023774 TaxID=3155015 RepID=UPI003405C989
MRAVRQATLEVGWWWLGLTGLWLLTLSSPTAPEVAAGALGSLVCAWAARVSRRVLGGRWGCRPKWISWAVRVPVAALRESALAWRAVLEDPSAGELEAIALPREPANRREGRVATATLVLGCTPGTMVVTQDGARLLVHRLPGGGTAALRQVAR